MEDKIKHDGVVQSVEGNHVKVQIVQTSACASCGARAACNAAESRKKTVDVWTAQPSLYHVGESVRVVGTYRAGMQATFLAFGMPLILLLASFFVNRTIVDDLTSVILSLCVLAVYYALLWFLRGKINKQFLFTLEKDRI